MDETKRTEPNWQETKQSHTEAANMVKITFQPVSAQKPEKDNDADKITIPQAHVSLHTLSVFVSFCGKIPCVVQH